MIEITQEMIGPADPVASIEEEYAQALPRVRGERAEAERKSGNTVPDGPLGRKIEAGVVGGAEGFAEQEQKGGVGVRWFRDDGVLKRIPSYALELGQLLSLNYWIWYPVGDSNPCCRRERAVS
ncbi:hypothetical protein ACOSOMT5_P0394 [Acidiphilium sp. MT5]